MKKKELKLGDRIKQIRTAKGLAQSAVERKTGFKREYLSKIENNNLQNPTYSTLVKLARGLGCHINDFTPRDEDNDLNSKVLELEGEIVSLKAELEKREKHFNKIKQFMGGDDS